MLSEHLARIDGIQTFMHIFLMHILPVIHFAYVLITVNPKKRHNSYNYLCVMKERKTKT